MKRLHDHTVVIRPEDNGTFVAYVPAISGCHAWGRTPEEAQAELANVFAMINEEAAKFSSEKSKISTHVFRDDRNLATPSESENVMDTSCPRCKRDCIFQWRDFKNGTRHIEQRCPHHGYIKYVPKIEPYLGWASKAKDGPIQKKLF
jgi:predicted RNase H-like HicB family nuclease